METGYITYYWQSTDMTALEAAVAPFPNLGIAQGGVAQTEPDLTQPQNEDGSYPTKPTGVVWGVAGTYYTVARSKDSMRTPAGLTLADPFDCTGLLGVFE